MAKVPLSIEPLRVGDRNRGMWQASCANEVIDTVNAFLKMEVQDYEVLISDGKVLLRKIDKTRNPEGGTSSTNSKVEQFRLIRQYREHIVCARWTADLSAVEKYNGTIGTQDTVEVRIAKCFESRYSHWAYDVVGAINGFRYGDFSLDGSERTATLIDASAYGAESIAWAEEVVPGYINAKSMIYATEVTQGSMAKVQEVPGGPYYDLNFIELNARAWMPKQKKIRVCVEGSNGAWFSLIRASEGFQEE